MYDLIINMDETPMYFDMVPNWTVSKKGAKEIRIRSSGAEKRRFTVVLACTSGGEMLPTLVIFKGKRQLKFSAPNNVKATVQVKGWMDSELMLRWFRGVVLPYTHSRKTLLVLDSFSAHESTEFLELARSKNVDISLIPGGCTSKVQPLDVCLNRPFKSALRSQWQIYMEEQMESDPNLAKLVTPSKEEICSWISAVTNNMNKEIVAKSFLVCGISNALDGSQNEVIRCARELPNLQLPYLDESDDDPFKSDDEADDSEVELDEVETSSEDETELDCLD